MDKFKTCKDCPNRQIEPNCHDNCEGYAFRKKERERIKDVIKKEKDFIDFKVTCENRSKALTKNARKRLR